MASDSVVDGLQALRDRLVASAERAGEGPTTAKKSSFRSEVDRRAFVEAHGQAAYDALEQ